MKKLFILLLTCITMLFASCNTINENREGKVSIMVYAAGYGMEWLEEAVKIYREDNPEVEFYIEGDPLAFESVKTKLENGNIKDDIILVSSGYYEQFVANGYLEDLSDLYETQIPGTETKVKDVIPQQIKDVRTVDGKIYGLPWQQNNPSGLIYNVEMFERYGWDEEMPETMDEFWAFCERISADTAGRVAPVTFGGADGRGYLDFNLCQWLCEYYGYDAIIDFLEMKSPEAFNSQSEGRTKIYTTLAKLTMGKTSGGYPIALEGSVGATAVTAQTNFVNGKAAMIFCGQWFPTEMEPYTSLTQFKSGYLPMPHINADKMSGDKTEDTSDIRFSTDGNMMAIPATSKNKEAAKDFLAHMFTSKSYTSFVKANNGLLRPVTGLMADTTGFDAFTLSAYQYFNVGGNARSIYQISKNPVLDRGTLAFFQAYRGAFFSTITSKSTYEEALTVANGCFANEMSAVYEKWNASEKKWY